MAKERKAKKPKPTTFRLGIDGYKLSAEKHGGRWSVWCLDWHDLAAKYDGCEDLSECIEEFTRRATAAAATEEPKP